MHTINSMAHSGSPTTVWSRPMTDPAPDHNPFGYLPAAPPPQQQTGRRGGDHTIGWIVFGVAFVAVVAIILYWLLVFQHAG